MSKIQAILRVYGKLNSSTSFAEEVINGWMIENVSRKELMQKFTEEEIEVIYYNAI